MDAELLERLHDKGFRDEYAARTLRESVGTQVQALRNSQGFSRGDLARLAHTSTRLITGLEEPPYAGFERVTTRTLSNIARVFDVALIIAFVSWGKYLGWAITPAGVVPLSFNEEFGVCAHGPQHLMEIEPGVLVCGICNHEHGCSR